MAGRAGKLAGWDFASRVGWLALPGRVVGGGWIFEVRNVLE